MPISYTLFHAASLSRSSHCGLCCHISHIHLHRILFHDENPAPSTNHSAHTTHPPAGITRERLEGYDRPITLEPQWFDGKKEPLIRDFRNYLGILKAVHSGADLQASAAAAGNRCGVLVIDALRCRGCSLGRGRHRG